MVYLTIGLFLINVLLVGIIFSKKNNKTETQTISTPEGNESLAIPNEGAKREPFKQDSVTPDVSDKKNEDLEELIKEFQKEQKKGLSELREQADKTSVVLDEENSSEKIKEDIEYDEAILFE